MITIKNMLEILARLEDLEAEKGKHAQSSTEGTPTEDSCCRDNNITDFPKRIVLGIDELIYNYVTYLTDAEEIEPALAAQVSQLMAIRNYYARV